MFPLLGHLIAEVGQLGGQLLHQLLRLVELHQDRVSIKGSYFYTRLSSCSTTHLPLERLPLVLLPVHVLDCQGDGAQPREPVQTLVLHTNYFSLKLFTYIHLMCSVIMSSSNISDKDSKIDH